MKRCVNRRSVDLVDHRRRFHPYLEGGERMASKEIPTTRVNASRLSCVLTLGAAVWLCVSMVSFVSPDA